MAGQSNIFPVPENVDPFGNPTYATNGIYEGNEQRPNIDPSQKKASQASWEKTISNPLNQIK